jgi:hypothetical protein
VHERGDLGAHVSLADDLLASMPYQDYVLLNGAQTPGLAYPTKAGAPLTWDERKGYGTTGASLIFMGAGLSEFDVQVWLWKPEHFVLWEVFAKSCLVDPPAGARPTSMPIKHPLLTLPPIAITQVVKRDCSQFEQVDDGLWACSIMLKRYRAPRPTLIKPFEGPPGSPEGVAPPASPEEQTVQNLGKQIDGLSLQLNGGAGAGAGG